MHDGGICDLRRVGDFGPDQEIAIVWPPRTFRWQCVCTLLHGSHRYLTIFAAGDVGTKLSIGDRRVLDVQSRMPAFLSREQADSASDRMCQFKILRVFSRIMVEYIG